MTDFQPKPQTPEQVDEGLRDAMKQAKEDGIFDWSGAQIHQPKVICHCDLFVIWCLQFVISRLSGLGYQNHITGFKNNILL